jgi:hypothetical protein
MKYINKYIEENDVRAILGYYLDFKDIATIYDQVFAISEDELLSEDGLSADHWCTLTDILEFALWVVNLALVKELDSKITINWDEIAMHGISSNDPDTILYALNAVGVYSYDDVTALFLSRFDSGTSSITIQYVP